jgi:hypothetical protein
MLETYSTGVVLDTAKQGIFFEVRCCTVLRNKA